MSLLFPTAKAAGSGSLPLLQERAFNVRLRCNSCERERSQVICLADEPNDPATIHDFWDSGVAREIDPDCIYCAETGATILGVSYQRQPGDEPPRSTE
ncbi:hypothetical protein [Methylobacterium oxalidis]|uniref:Uncharacterized protein n=1 Tax=Methylobacterium oxalidis TaxID=944322 RepID=A0A512J918_9HYPH|nr:hypothetical protein [Methylobacterium oxalidis]GEP06452.1 hypothetical protein MOX02_44900 [Methylobacterium oxalidis]GLS65492.1 hypothetical protein GCM10007888_38740 [Methylobacterium oxalidis]